MNIFNSLKISHHKKKSIDEVEKAPREN